jgi:hypothetical protein
MPTLRSLLLRILPVLLSAAAAGCSSSKSSSGGCNPADASSCQNGQVCEPVSGGGTVCAGAVQVTGKVYDLADAAPGITGARVVALDASQAPLAPAYTTAAGGQYTITVPATRNADGSPTGSITLRADAAGYETFPSGLRTAIPVALSTATLTSGTYQVGTATDIGLAALPAGSYATLHGTVAAAPSKGGILVVAAPEAGGTGVSGFADESGAYDVFNLPVAAGGTSWTVKPYAQGANYAVSATSPSTSPLTLMPGDDKEVDFSVGSTVPHTLTGGIQFAGQNLPAAPQTTSVILVVKSTYDSILHRGEAPPGLRDGNATSAGFTITGVPDGDYMVLAAFENDGMVQDPGQGSTGVYEAVISGGALTAVYLNGALQSSQTIQFKVTGAVSLSTPFTGTYDSAPWPATSSTPSFDWIAYPSTYRYDVEVIDSLGNLACEKTGIPGNTSPLTFTWNATDCFGAASAAPATWYQLVVKAYQNGTGGVVEASFSEDLKGVFYTP